MLMAAGTPQGAGIAFYGNSHDLDCVAGTIETLCRGAWVLMQTLLVPIGIAKEFRAAAAGERDRQQFGVDEYDGVTYHAVRILWPPVVFSVPFVRWRGLFSPISLQDQANLFRLQSIVEKALLDFDPRVGPECVHLLRMEGGVPTTYLGGYIQQTTVKYLRSGEGATRFARLPAIMRSFSSVLGEYAEYANRVEAMAREARRDPGDIAFPAEMPVFEW